MKKMWAAIVLVLLVAIAVLAWSRDPVPRTLPQEEARAVITYPNGTIELADVADTPMERAKGLSDRDEPQSMIFFFEEKAQHVFWMKDMRFAIDIVWLDRGVVVGVTKGLQPEEPAKTFYGAPAPVQTVLEVPAGTVEKLDLQIGDLLDIEWNPQ